MKPSSDNPQFDCLSSESIDTAMGIVDTLCSDNLVDQQQGVLCRLLLEDALLRYRERDESLPFDMVFKRSTRSITITLRVQGIRSNVLDEHTFAYRELIDLALKPTWKYRRGRNIIALSLPVQTPLNKETLKKLSRYMESEKEAFKKGVLMRLLNMTALVLEPWLAAKVIEGLSAGDVNMILTNAALVLVVEVASSLFTYFGTCNLERAYHAMITELRIDVMENVPHIKTELIDASGTGVFSERIVGEAYNVANGINNLVVVFTDVCHLISLLIAFATNSFLVMGYELLLFVVFILIVRMQSKKQIEDSRRVSVASEAFSGLVSETVRANRDIKLLHCEESFLVQARDVIGTLSERSLDRRTRVNKHKLARSQFVAIANLAFMGILALLIGQFGMLPATALVLYTYNGKLYDIAASMAGANDDYYALLLSAERIYQLIKGDEFAKESFGTKTLENVSGAIELRDVSFSYAQKGVEPVPVLNGMNLRIRAGQSVALVGRNGCGKSTILSLIARLYEPTEGTITLDGVELGRLDRDTIRNSIGVVSQSPYLFNMSIRDNFALVKSDVTDKEMVEACKTACIHDDIMELPNAYDTVVGEGGCMLSGGQRQRIALARAFLKNYPVFMLDEATSALDNETQASICETIRNMRGKGTVIMIAHRLPIISDFDQIAYIQGGKVLAAGTHHELMESCPKYRKLYTEDAS